MIIIWLFVSELYVPIIKYKQNNFQKTVSNIGLNLELLKYKCYSTLNINKWKFNCLL